MEIIKKTINTVFGLNDVKNRKIKGGPLDGMFYCGNYSDGRYFSGFENNIVKKIKQNIKNGNIYDIGGHFGFYALLFSTLLKEGNVYSFEPNPYCFKILNQNIKINNLEGKVKTFNFGLGKEEKIVEMMIILGNMARSTCDDDSKRLYEEKKKNFETKDVIIKRLDDLNLPAPGFIKIDVEGMELDVIEGCYETIKKNRPEIIIEIHESQRKNLHSPIKKLVQILSNLGYFCFSIDENRSVTENIPLTGHLYFSTKE